MHQKYFAAITFVIATLAWAMPQASASVRFYKNESDWLAAVSGVEMLTIDANGVALATEVAAPPVLDQSLGTELTFDAADTGLSLSFELEALQPGASVVFGDDASARWADSLSIGRIDYYEDDDWQIRILPGSAPIRAFAFTLVDSHRGDGESFSIYDAADDMLGSTIDIPYEIGGDDDDRVHFLGVVSSSPIVRIEFDEGLGDDDIAIGDMRFAAIPEPATMSLLAMGGLAMLRRRREQ